MLALLAVAQLAFASASGVHHAVRPALDNVLACLPIVVLMAGYLCMDTKVGLSHAWAALPARLSSSSLPDSAECLLDTLQADANASFGFGRASLLSGFAAALLLAAQRAHAGLLLLAGAEPSAVQLPLVALLAALGVSVGALVLLRPSLREILAAFSLRPREVHRARVVQPEVVAGAVVSEPGKPGAAAGADAAAAPPREDPSRPVVVLLVAAAASLSGLLVIDAALFVPVR